MPNLRGNEKRQADAKNAVIEINTLAQRTQGVTNQEIKTILRKHNIHKSLIDAVLKNANMFVADDGKYHTNGVSLNPAATTFEVIKITFTDIEGKTHTIDNGGISFWVKIPDYR